LHFTLLGKVCKLPHRAERDQKDKQIDRHYMWHASNAGNTKRTAQSPRIKREAFKQNGGRCTSHAEQILDNAMRQKAFP
jgi:hypothetical protein